MPKDLPIKQVVSNQRKLTDIHIHADPDTRAVSARFLFAAVTVYADGTKDIVPGTFVGASAEELAPILTPELYSSVSAFAHGLADARESVPTT